MDTLIAKLSDVIKEIGKDIKSLKNLSLTTTGRPDKIDTIPQPYKQKVQNAANGTTFTSTDGAGVNAWQWIKTPTGWETLYADTGWRRILTEIPFTSDVKGLDVRRVNNLVYIRIVPILNTSGFTLTSPVTKSRISINLPDGFILPARTTSAIYSDEGIVGYMMIRRGDGSSSYGGADMYITSKVSNTRLCAWSTNWTANDDYPETLPGEAV